MNTGTKIAIAGVGAIVFMVIVYSIAKKVSVGTGTGASALPPGSAPQLDPVLDAQVPIMNYNDRNSVVINKPVMGGANEKTTLGMKGAADAIIKPSLKDLSVENASKSTLLALGKPKMG